VSFNTTLAHYDAVWGGRQPYHLTQFFHSDAIPLKPTAVTNFSHCDVADAEITAARTEPDSAKQLALWATAQQKIAAEVCAVPIYQNLQLWAWKDTLDLGFEVNGSLNLSPAITEVSRFTE